MVNCNPETVSTDYDTSDRLYFEPLSPEEVLAVLDREQPLGVVTQFGGQTPLRLARHIEAAGYKILGTPHAAIDLAEDRELFGALARELGVRCPPWFTVESVDEALDAAREIGFPGARAPVLRPRRARDAHLRRRRRSARRDGSGQRPGAHRSLRRERGRDRRRRPLRRDGRLHRCRDAARRGGRRPFRRLVLRAPGAVADARERARGRARRQAARPGARGRRAAQRPACDRGLGRLRPRGEPARLADGALREQGDGCQPRRRRPAASPMASGSPTSGSSRRARRGQRQGGRAPVRPLPRRRPGARAGDALHGRGDGDRLRPADRVREGRARGRTTAADARVPRSSPSATATRRASRRSRQRSPGSGSSSSRRPERRARCAPQGSRSRRSARSPTRSRASRPSST